MRGFNARHILQSPRGAVTLLLLVPLAILLSTSLPYQLNKTRTHVGLAINSHTNGQLEILYVEPGGPAEQAGIRPGMRILAYENQPVRNEAELDRLWLKNLDHQLNLTLASDNGQTRVYAIIPGARAHLSKLVVRLLGAFYFFGMVLVLLRQWQQTEARLLIALLLILSMDFLLPFSQVSSQSVNAWLWRINLWNLALVMVLKLHFVLIFPRPIALYARYRKLVLAGLYLFMLPGLLLFAQSIEDTLNPQSTQPFFTLQVVVMLSIWLFLGWRYLREGNPEWKKQLRIVWLFDTPFSLSQLLWHLHVYVMYTQWLEWFTWTEQLFLALWPTGIFIAIIRHNYLHLGQVLQVTSIRIFLNVLIWLLILVFALETYALLAREMHGSLAMIGSSIPALLMATQVIPASHRLYNWLERGLLSPTLGLHYAFRGFLEQQDQQGSSLQQILRKSLDFLQSRLQLPWLALYCPQTPASTEIQVQNGQPPARIMKNVRTDWQHAQELAELDEAQIEQTLALQCDQNPPHGLLILGRNPDKPRHFTEEEKRDLELIAQDLAGRINRDQLNQLASTDKLTGTLRREAVLEALRLLLAQSQRQQSALGLCMMDLDHFKAINDRWGHPAGDEVLRNTAAIIQSCLRNSDVLGRYGGEEFLLVLPACDKAGMQTLMNKIYQAIDAKYQHGDKEAPPVARISAGCIHVPAHSLIQSAETGAAQLLQQADQWLYQAKAQGRNRYLIREWKPKQGR